MMDVEKVQCWNLVDELRSEEGDSVTINCDNPDGEPHCAVECCGSWTDYRDRRFWGPTMLNALLSAVDAYREINR